MVQNPMLADEHIRRKLEQQGLVLDRNYMNGLVTDIQVLSIRAWSCRRFSGSRRERSLRLSQNQHERRYALSVVRSDYL
jgi:hypothetical protein